MSFIVNQLDRKNNYEQIPEPNQYKDVPLLLKGQDLRYVKLKAANQNKNDLKLKNSLKMIKYKYLLLILKR